MKHPFGFSLIVGSAAVTLAACGGGSSSAPPASSSQASSITTSPTPTDSPTPLGGWDGAIAPNFMLTTEAGYTASWAPPSVKLGDPGKVTIEPSPPPTFTLTNTTVGARPLTFARYVQSGLGWKIPAGLMKYFAPAAESACAHRFAKDEPCDSSRLSLVMQSQGMSCDGGEKYGMCGDPVTIPGSGSALLTRTQDSGIAISTTNPAVAIIDVQIPESAQGELEALLAQPPDVAWLTNLGVRDGSEFVYGTNGKGTPYTMLTCPNTIVVSPTDSKPMSLAQAQAFAGTPCDKARIPAG